MMEYDSVIQEIVDYVLNPPEFSKKAVQNAGWSFLDAIGGAVYALKFTECTKLLGPVVPNAELVNGSRIPGCAWQLDPVQAAFNIGTMVRWLDFNDTWLAAEWAHPSDNLGAIIAVTDYMNRCENKQYRLDTIIEAMIVAYEIQGILALNHAFNRQGLDHVILVKLASSLVAAKLMGGDRDMLLRTASQVFVDGQSLRTYRHYPNTGSRKSWAAGDATARGVRLALISRSGEMGYPTAISAHKWGFSAVSYAHQALELLRPLNCYVMENILWKIAYPAEFHAQTAVECALRLHADIRYRIDDVVAIAIKTQEPALRIISKQGELKNPADRDHCLEYMVAVALALGRLEATDYEYNVAKKPIIDKLRNLMHVTEDPQFTKDYYDLNKRSIASAIKIDFIDGTSTGWITEHYPLGHPARREEGLPLLKQKFLQNLRSYYNEEQVSHIKEVFLSEKNWLDLSLDNFFALFHG